MPKRKLEEEPEIILLDDALETKKPEVKVGVKKNSLDSDEDESDTDEKAYQILAEDDIEGQEEATAQFDGDVPITPFNMKEEMEEGHFDADGHYHFNKDAGEIKDNWLDNIDWVKVRKEGPGEEGAKKEEKGSDSSDSDDDLPPFDHISSYKKIIEFLQPGESVGKALRRLGGSTSLTASQRLKLKKKGQSQMEVDSGDKVAMLALTELANDLLNGTGNMNVYQETFEQISRTIAGAAAKAMPPPAKPAAVLDMYADDFDEKEKARLADEENKQEESSGAPETAEKPPEDLAGTDEVSWEFKWSEEKEDVHGPHTSAQMLAWVKDGYFKDSVVVRKVGAESAFYSSRRVDFDLYI